MAFLVPLLLPSILDATTNVALGITNAVQGTSSSVTFQIGPKVYSSAKGFPLGDLPEEVREVIILMALERSKELIQPSILVSRPLSLSPTAIPIQHPLRDPKSPHYRSIRGEWQVANGYPVSAWKWLTVDREWRDVLRRRLWREIVLDTSRTYKRFLKFLEDGQLEDILERVQSLQLDQGFDDPSDLYGIIRHPKLVNLRRLAILGSWPYSSSLTARPTPLFKFGIQLVPAPPVRPLLVRETDDDESGEYEFEEREEDVKRLDVFTLGLPLELATNAVARQHLALLRPRRLEITLVLHQLDPRLVEELADLLADKITTLGIRYLASDRGMDLPNPADLLSPTLDRFPAVDIHLPHLTSPSPAPHIIPHRVYQGQEDPYTSFSQRVVHLITADPDRRRRYAVWLEGETPALGPFGQGSIKPEERVVWAREVDVPWSIGDEGRADELVGQAGPSDAKERASTDKGKGKARDDEPAEGDHWERETNLKLLGGLISLRLESKKH